MLLEQVYELSAAEPSSVSRCLQPFVLSGDVLAPVNVLAPQLSGIYFWGFEECWPPRRIHPFFFLNPPFQNQRKDFSLSSTEGIHVPPKHANPSLQKAWRSSQQSFTYKLDPADWRGASDGGRHVFSPSSWREEKGGKRRNEEGGAYVPATSLDPFERLELQHTSSWD